MCDESLMYCVEEHNGANLETVNKEMGEKKRGHILPGVSNARYPFGV